MSLRGKPFKYLVFSLVRVLYEATSGAVLTFKSYSFAGKKVCSGNTFFASFCVYAFE